MKDFFDDLNDWIWRILPSVIVTAWIVCLVLIIRGLINGSIR